MNRLLILLVATLLLAGLPIAGAQSAAQAEKLFASAQRKATIDGDLTGAIEEYKKVVAAAGGNRTLAARALLHMAECHQKLGDLEAQTIYERLVREYADQKDAAASARARLARNVPAARQLGDRVVKSGEDITWGDGRVSPDGRFISYTDWNYTGNLMLHDVVTGTDKPLTGNTDWSVGNAYSSTFSPDGKQVAYGWRTYAQNVKGQPQAPHANEIRIIDITRPGSQEPRIVYRNDDINFFNPTDWSPDGRYLAATVTRKDNTGQIAVVGVRDGSFQVLKTIGWRGPKKVFFSSDGRYLAYDLPAGDAEVQRDVFVLAVDGSGETRVVDHEADDVIMGWSSDGGRLLVASDRTGAVALWTVPIANGKVVGAPALLKPDIGSITSQGLTTSGALHLVKNASTVSLQVALIDLESGQLSGAPVLENFRSGVPTWTSDGKLLAYRSTSANDRQLLSVRALDTGRLLSVPLMLQYMAGPRWLQDGRALVSAGRDLKGRGGIFRIDAETGRESMIVELDGNTDRVQVSPDGKKIYYAVGGNALQSAVPAVVERDLATGQVREVYRRTPGMSAAELSSDGQSFAVVTVDSHTKASILSVIPVSGGAARELFRVSSPESLQGYGGMAWTPDSRAVLVLKTTGDRFDPKDLWLVPVNGDKTRKLDMDVRNWTTGEIKLHPDGTHIAFFIGRDVREVWALENILPGRVAETARPKR